MNDSVGKEFNSPLSVPLWEVFNIFFRLKSACPSYSKFGFSKIREMSVLEKCPLKESSLQRYTEICRRNYAQ